MRFGDWYVHDATSVKLVRSSLVCSFDDMLTPAHVAAFVELHHKLLGPIDVVHLLAAANELVWQAFNFTGIGDWLDANGVQRGREEAIRAAI